VVRRLWLFLAAIGLPACYGSHNETGDGELDATPHDTAGDGDVHETADAVDAACTVDPSARSNGGYVVTRLEVVRPAVFGGVAPTLTSRIDTDDIFVVLGTNLVPTATAFRLEVGQAVERLYPSPRAQFCRDEICGWPPNQVTIFDATAACNDFGTDAPADLVFSLYPPSHPASATPLRIVNATIRGQFDARRDRIVNGMLLGAILEDATPVVYPMFDISLDELLTAAGVAKDYDGNGDGRFEGWNIELRFEADWVVLEDG